MSSSTKKVAGSTLVAGASITARRPSAIGTPGGLATTRVASAKKKVAGRPTPTAAPSADQPQAEASLGNDIDAVIADAVNGLDLDAGEAPTAAASPVKRATPAASTAASTVPKRVLSAKKKVVVGKPMASSSAASSASPAAPSTARASRPGSAAVEAPGTARARAPSRVRSLATSTSAVDAAPGTARARAPSRERSLASATPATTDSAPGTARGRAASRERSIPVRAASKDRGPLGSSTSASTAASTTPRPSSALRTPSKERSLKPASASVTSATKVAPRSATKPTVATDGTDIAASETPVDAADVAPKRLAAAKPSAAAAAVATPRRVITMVRPAATKTGNALVVVPVRPSSIKKKPSSSPPAEETAAPMKPLTRPASGSIKKTTTAKSPTAAAAAVAASSATTTAASPKPATPRGSISRPSSASNKKPVSAAPASPAPSSSRKKATAISISPATVGNNKKKAVIGSPVAQVAAKKPAAAAAAPATAATDATEVPTEADESESTAVDLPETQTAITELVGDDTVVDAAIADASDVSSEFEPEAALAFSPPPAETDTHVEHELAPEAAPEVPEYAIDTDEPTLFDQDLPPPLPNEEATAVGTDSSVQLEDATTDSHPIVEPDQPEETVPQLSPEDVRARRDEEAQQVLEALLARTPEWHIVQPPAADPFELEPAVPSTPVEDETTLDSNESSDFATSTATATAVAADSSSSFAPFTDSSSLGRAPSPPSAFDTQFTAYGAAPASSSSPSPPLPTPANAQDEQRRIAEALAKQKAEFAAVARAEQDRVRAELLVREAAREAAEAERAEQAALSREMEGLASELINGSEVWKMSSGLFASPKLVYLYLCSAREVDPARMGDPVHSSFDFANAALRWDSRSKTSSEASLLLTRECRVRIGTVLKQSVPDELPNQNRWSLSITTTKRAMECVFNTRQEFEAWAQVAAFIVQTVGATFEDDYTTAK